MMSTAPPKLAKVCEACGASNPGHRTQCWLCEGPLRVPAAEVPVPSTPYERHAAFQFSFASLMVTIALIAVLLGVFRLWPGIGVLLVIIVAPAWIRTCVTVALRQSRQGTLTFGKKATIFATSLAIVVGIGVMLIAAIVSAFATFCTVIAANQETTYVPVTLTVAAISSAVLVVTGLIMWASWRHSRRARL
jgi:hypothetical protein